MFLLYDNQCNTVKPIYGKQIGKSPGSRQILIWESHEVTITLLCDGTAS